ncbi:MAG: TadE/TadG family type IV pilus assembly protein [Nocardioides sp.]|uniref:TadE/TadG family type IV pilus assembly protein n=1 Tax=Nocardioides sp. TaxID=35761 RepID=UPI0039E64175
MRRRSRPAAVRARDDRAAAVVDFVLVTMLLLPLVLGVLQLGLVLYVRNTLASAASEGARYAATLGHRPGDGSARARSQVAGVLSGRYAGEIRSLPASIDGAPAVEVRISAHVPALGIGGPGVSFTVAAHAVREQR